MMVRVHLAFVPPGGGETDYSRFAELPAVPATGDYLTWASGTGKGTMDFIVRRVWWGVKGDQDGDWTTDEITVECEFALGPEPTEEHRRQCEIYRERGKPARKLDSSAY